MTANRTLIVHKCANVIKEYSELSGVPLREAFDLFYKSNLYTEIREGISDMHCRSDGYLAEELQMEVGRASGDMQLTDHLHEYCEHNTMIHRLLKVICYVFYAIAGFFLVYSVYYPLAYTFDHWCHTFAHQSKLYSIAGGGVMYAAYAILLAAPGFILSGERIAVWIRKVFSFLLFACAIFMLAFCVLNLVWVIGFEYMDKTFYNYAILIEFESLVPLACALMAVLAMFIISGKTLSIRMKKAFVHALYAMAGILFIIAVYNVPYYIHYESSRFGLYSVMQTAVRVGVLHLVFPALLAFLGFTINGKAPNGKLLSAAIIALYIIGGFAFARVVNMTISTVSEWASYGIVLSSVKNILVQLVYVLLFAAVRLVLLAKSEYNDQRIST